MFLYIFLENNYGGEGRQNSEYKITAAYVVFPALSAYSQVKDWTLCKRKVAMPERITQIQPGKKSGAPMALWLLHMAREVIR